MFTKLLVGLDGSPPAEVALAQALHVGRRFQSTLVLVHISRPETLTGELVRALGAPWREGRPSPTSIPELEVEEGARHLLEEAAGAVRRAGLQVETTYRAGDVATELYGMAEEVDAVFVGRVGRRGGTDPLGPDTRELIRKAPKPVVVCGSTVSEMQRCAIAYDGEPASMRALSLAARYAQVTGARLEVIHANPNDSKGRETLARAATALSESPVHFETHLEGGDVHEAVRNAVQRLGCDALFAGAHREEGRFEVPSHTEAILRATDIPVLVHNEPQNLSARVSASYRRPPS